VSGVLVDTSVWSIAFRGKMSGDVSTATELTKLINSNQAKIIGAIRQEILSGYSNKQSYEKLRTKLMYFPNEPVLDGDYEAAAEFSNFCRAKGVQGSHADFLICAVAVRCKFKIFTADKDFDHYVKYLPVSLHKSR
jgi:predicted nucleic acid-binding protein